MLLFAHPENTGTAHAQAPGKPGLAAAAALAVVQLENKQCMLVVVVTGVEDEELDEDWSSSQELLMWLVTKTMPY